MKERLYRALARTEAPPELWDRIEATLDSPAGARKIAPTRVAAALLFTAAATMTAYLGAPRPPRINPNFENAAVVLAVHRSPELDSSVGLVSCKRPTAPLRTATHRADKRAPKATPPRAGGCFGCHAG